MPVLYGSTENRKEPFLPELISPDTRLPVNKKGTAAVQTLTPGLRRFLYFTAASTGAAILIVEILGAKMLSPYLGTSHFVWTAQIAVTLLSLAVGYWFGGWLVDRSQKLQQLYLCILAAGIYLALTIPFTKNVAYACLSLSLPVGSLLASLFLFFVPLTLLAVTGPFCIRILTSSVNAVGGNVGRLSAISTLGSVLGTVLIGYVLIPFLPNSVTMLITAGYLAVLSFVFLFMWRSKSGSNLVPVILTTIALLAGYRGVQLDGKSPSDYFTEIERTNSNFGLMQVMEVDGGLRRYYLNDYLTQNTYDPETGQSTSLFTHMLHGLAHYYTRSTDEVFCIGLGVGIVPMLFANEGSQVDVVEINDKIVDLGARHFGLKPNKLNITIGDGRYYLNQSRKQYDAVILDAFLGDSSPSHLMTREAFSEMSRVLKPEGVLVINSFGEFGSGKDFFTASLDKTLKAVFRQVRIHASGNGNVFYVATNAESLDKLRDFPFDKAYPENRQGIDDALAGIRQVNPRSGIVLTDDFNPVEFHDAGNREELRRNLAFSMRSM